MASNSAWERIKPPVVNSAAFNNLGRPHYSTLFNWARTLLGIVPLVAIGAWAGEAAGVIAGLGAANVLFGALTVLSSYVIIRKLP